MPKQKVLIIDNVFAPSKKDRIINGVQKFTKAQREVLSEYYDVHYITMRGSDLQYPNQYILRHVQDVNLDNNRKRAITKAIADEIKMLIHVIEPDIVLDNSCKHFTTNFPFYKTGIVFEHYHKPSMPLTDAVKQRFVKNKIFWCGVSNWQNKQFRNFFDGVTSVHMLEEEQFVTQSDGYGMFVGRWDRGKKPHVMLNRYSRMIDDIPLHVFTTFKNCYLTEDDLKIVNILKKNKKFIFHVDAPRSELESYMQRASFILGSGNESTGIVSMEGASFGVPYIVPGSNSVAEQEHMHPEAIYLLDRTSGDSMNEQLLAAVHCFANYSLEHRKQIAKDAYLRYNKSQFLLKQLRLIKKAKELYGTI